MMLNSFLDSIEQNIAEEVKKNKNYNAFTGIGGAVLFYFYYYKYTNKVKFKNLGFKYLQEILNNLHTIKSVGLCDGLTGIAWIISICRNEGFIEEEDAEDVLKELNPIILKWTLAYAKNSNFDFLYGSIGGASYLVENLVNESLTSFTDDYVKILSEKGRIKEQGIYWDAWDFENNCPAENIYDCGMAHGNISILLLLLKISEINPSNSESKTLLYSSISLLKFLFPKQNPQGSFFPFTFNFTEVEHDNGSRLGWCYGDLGCSLALLKINGSIEDKEINDWITSLTINVLKIQKECSVEDNGFCHGNAGCSYLNYKLFSMTEDIRFNELSKRWFRKTCSMPIEKDINLIFGLSGIGLSLMSITHKELSGWEKLFAM